MTSSEPKVDGAAIRAVDPLRCDVAPDRSRHRGAAELLGRRVGGVEVEVAEDDPGALLDEDVRAMASPMPWAPPVMTAVRLASSSMGVPFT